MAKSFMVATFLAATALCFTTVLTSAADDSLIVSGQVYCDPCRVEFQTSISKVMENAKVKLTCRNRENDTVTFSAEAQTGANGMYTIPVKGDHEEDICEVRLVESLSKDCKVPFKKQGSARVLVTKNVGVVSPVRLANALGFMTEKADKRCPKVLEAMGFPALNVEELVGFINHN